MALVGTTVDYSPLNSVACPLPAPPAHEIQFVTANPSAPHAEQGLIEVKALGSGHGATQDAMAHLREEGWRRGCHFVRLAGMSIKPREHYSDSKDPIIGLLDLIATDPHERKLVSASCIVLTDPECKPFAAAAPAPPIPKPPAPPAPPAAPPPAASSQRGFTDAPPLR